VLETVLSLIPSPSLRALGPHTLRACAVDAIARGDVERAVQFVSNLPEHAARHPMCMDLAVRLAGLSAAVRNSFGARTALRLARVMFGESPVGLLRSEQEDFAAQQSLRAAVSENAATRARGGVSLPDALREDVVAETAARDSSLSDLSCAAWPLATRVVSCAIRTGDAALADEVAMWTEKLPLPPPEQFSSLLAALSEPGSGLELDADLIRAIQGEDSLEPVAFFDVIRRSARHGRLLSRAVAGDVAGLLYEVALAAQSEAAAEVSGSCPPPSVVEWSFLRHLAATLVGEGSLRVQVESSRGMVASGEQGSLARIQSQVMAELSRQVLESTEEVLSSPHAMARRGCASTSNGLSLHVQARVLQFACHVAELTQRAAELPPVVIDVLSPALPPSHVRDAEAAAVRSRSIQQVARSVMDSAAAGKQLPHVDGPLREAGAIELLSRYPDAITEALSVPSLPSGPEQFVDPGPFPGRDAVAAASGAALAALASPRAFVERGPEEFLSALSSLFERGLFFGPHVVEATVAYLSRIGLLDNAMGVCRAVPPAHLTVDAVLHIVRAAALRGDAGMTRSAGQLLVRVANERGEPVPVEGRRLMLRVES
jgi:hypothetical protein